MGLTALFDLARLSRWGIWALDSNNYIVVINTNTGLWEPRGSRVTQSRRRYSLESRLQRVVNHM